MKNLIKFENNRLTAIRLGFLVGGLAVQFDSPRLANLLNDKMTRCRVACLYLVIEASGETQFVKLSKLEQCACVCECCYPASVSLGAFACLLFPHCAVPQLLKSVLT